MFTGADVKGSGGLSHICGAADITTGFIHDIGPGAIRTRGFYRAFSQLAGQFLRFFPCQLQDCVGSRVDQANHTQTTMFENALDLCVKAITDVRQMENAIILWFGLTLLCV